MSNPFSKDYKPQVDLKGVMESSRRSKKTSASLAKRRESDDPSVRAMAIGTITGLSKKSDEAIRSKAKRAPGFWPKDKPLNQPPINGRAVLPHEAHGDKGKTARLSRGRAI